MKLTFNQKIKKGILSIVGLLFLITSLFTPLSAKAQAGGVVSDPGAVVQRESLFGRNEAKLGLSEALFSGVVGGMVNFISYFTRKLAYDAALFLSTADKGQRELIYKGGFNDYLGNVVTDSAATFIGELGQPFGLNLCQVPDLNIQVFLQIGIGGLFDIYGPGGGGPTPTCTFQELRDGWSNEAFEQKYGGGASRSLARTFAKSIDISTTDFGVALTAIGQIENRTEGVRVGNLNDRLEGQGFKPVTDLISGNIITPAESVRRQVSALDPQERAKTDIDQLSKLYEKELTHILPTAGKVFLGTLTSNLLNQFAKGLFPDKPQGGQNGDTQGVVNFFAQEIKNNRIQAQNAFAFLFTGLPTRQENYDIIGQFATCPASNPGINNCVIDRGLQGAISRARSGRPLTIAEALETENDLLHADWSLISPRREVDNVLNIDNTRGACYERAYCYSNLQKLRKARILPIGFEIAAAKADPDHPEQWTLKKVVDGFYDCDYDKDDNGEPVLDDDGRLVIIHNPEKPFCNLINPNWIIDAPEARCEAEVYTTQFLANNIPDRQRECVDVSTCVAKNDQGQCISYGYCTKEKNIWELGVDNCPAYASTCTTYANTKTNQNVSYLSRTVDFGECNIDSVGCRAYSTEQNGEDWVSSPDASLALKEFGRNQSVYFNEKIKDRSCPAGAVGCTAFDTAEIHPITKQYVKQIDGKYHRDERSRINLKKAPDYLGCYDINRDTPQIDWPQTETQLRNNLVDNAECNSYAGVCIEEEVGCELYSPLAGGPSVPGIIGANICSSQCVGYQTFRQLGYTNEAVNGQGFEPARYPLYFIPPPQNENAEKCSALFAGCDEFTNIEDGANGGERLEYYTKIRSCVDPDENTEKTYYTWEGSAQDGFVLQTHKLVRIDANENNYINRIDLELIKPNGQTDDINEVFEIGSPAYADDTKSALENNFTECNRDAYDNLINGVGGEKASPDCRAFFDNQGNIYYRLLDQTITVSESCRRLRKSESNLVYDEDLSTAGQTFCEQRGGLWGFLPETEQINDVDSPVCRRCTGGGNFIGGSCVYEALVEQSLSCPAAANQCRAFVGNTGNNRQEIFGNRGEEFEPTSDAPDALVTARQNWFPEEGIEVASEALQVGQHSLQVAVQTSRRIIDPEILQTGKLYELTFWARGGSQNLDIFFEENNSSVFLLKSILYGVEEKFVDTRNNLQSQHCQVEEANQNIVESFRAQLTDLRNQIQATIDNRVSILNDNIEFRQQISVILRQYTQMSGRITSEIEKTALDWTNNCNEPLLEVQGEEPDLEASLFNQTKRLNAFTYDPLTDTDVRVGVGAGWQEYKLGPIEFNGNINKLAAITFVQEFLQVNPVPLYLDNVRLTRVQDTEYLIKDSWKTDDGLDAPEICFGNVDPDVGLPGNALGCEAYTDSDGTNHYATSFDSLCREKAVGCSPLYDTFNTLENGLDSQQTQLFNIRCELTVDEDEGRICSAVVGDSDYSCTVEPGQTECYINNVAVVLPDDYKVLFDSTGEILFADDSSLSPNKLFVTDSTVLIPADTPSTTPIFLTDSAEFRCGSNQIGCQQIALEEHIIPTDNQSSFEFIETAVLNNPDTYLGDNGVLCREDLLGCSQYQSGSNAFFFKDPTKTGQQICEYDDSSIDSQGNSQNFGWFIKDVGHCGETEDLCREDSDCSDNTSCQDIGGISCYDNFLQRGGEYGIWSNESENYKGFVGECSPQFNQCKELIDVADTTANNPEGQPYYVIFNNKIENRIGECNGEVSLEEGCVLFDQTDKPNKIYDSVETYKKSASGDPAAPFKRVSPESTVNNDTNVILKIDRERACSEWLSCKTVIPQEDQNGNVTELCYDYKPCSEVDSNGNCINWVDTSSDPLTLEKLTEKKYAERPNHWYAIDYSGYSLFNKYQIANFTPISFSTAGTGVDDGDSIDPDLQYIVYEPPPHILLEGESCFNQNGNTKDDWSICGVDGGGRCYNAKCIYPIDGQYPDNVDEDTPNREKIKGLLDVGICKGYPEKNSPINREIAAPGDRGVVTLVQQGNQVVKRDEFTEKPIRYSGSSVCQEKGEKCSCEYQKIEYGNSQFDYWGIDAGSNIGAGICSGGALNGYPCSVENDCKVIENDAVVSSGSCTLIKQRSKHVGLRGFCLEYDLSRPIDKDQGIFTCQTWLPINVSASNADIYNADPKAGYLPGTDAVVDNNLHGGEAYCVNATGVNAGAFEASMVSGEIFPGNVNIQSNERVYHKNFFNQTENGRRDSGVFQTPYSPNWWCDTRTVPDGCAYIEDRLYNADCSSRRGGVGDTEYIRSQYAEAHCRNEGEETQKRQYSLLQSWVGKYGENIGVIPVILRLDTYGLSRSDPKSEFVQNGFASSHLETEISAAIHPPIPWGAEDVYKNETDLEDLYYFEYQFGDRPVSYLTHSPGRILGESFGEDVNKIWRNPAESQIKEGDLSRVYFVPLSYPGGAQDRLPALGSAEMYIDFNLLNPTSKKYNGVGYDRHSVATTNGESNNNYIFEYAENANGGIVSTYVITKDDDGDESLKTYMDYRTRSDQITYREAGKLFTDFARYYKNEIYRRYVMVFWISGGMADPDGKPLVNPFAGGETNRNILAIGLDFNRDGDFLGYISSFSQNVDNNNTRLKLGTVALLSNKCTEFAEVYTENPVGGPIIGTTNKAWTNRVWENASIPTENNLIPQGWGKDNPAIKPYGSLAISGKDIKTSNGELKNHRFINPLRDGTPYDCNTPWFGDTLFNLSLSCSTLVDHGYNRDIVNSISVINGLDLLHKLFAKVYSRVAYNPSTGNLSNYTDAQWLLEGQKPDDSEFVGVSVSLQPPRIYSLNPATCFGQGECSAAEKHNITVNAKNGTLEDYDGDGNGEDPPIGADEDFSRDGNPDALVAVEILRAVTRFFAFADDNRMPLRRVMVNWGDGSPITNENRKGLYKNRKPFCGEGVDIGECTGHPGLTCTLAGVEQCPGDSVCEFPQESSLHFGNTDRACTPRNFEFIHDYVCSEAELANPNVEKREVREFEDQDTRLLLQNFNYLPSDRVCVFKPGVQALDNWGWCNGSNFGPQPGTYVPREEGRYNDNLDENCKSSSNFSWTYYQGEIVVGPRINR